MTEIETFEKQYPELSKEFKEIQQEMYKLFARKQMDYGLNNIALGTGLSISFSNRRKILTKAHKRLHNLLSLCRMKRSASCIKYMTAS